MSSTPTTTRPAEGTRVRVTFTNDDPTEGTVILLDHDSILIGAETNDHGPAFTGDIVSVYDAQQADGTAVLEVL